MIAIAGIANRWNFSECVNRFNDFAFRAAFFSYSGIGQFVHAPYSFVNDAVRLVRGVQPSFEPLYFTTASSLLPINNHFGAARWRAFRLSGDPLASRANQ
jgi:hypothetical protein